MQRLEDVKLPARLQELLEKKPSAVDGAAVPVMKGPAIGMAGSKFVKSATFGVDRRGVHPVGGQVVGRDGWNSLMQQQPTRGGVGALLNTQGGMMPGQQQMMARPQEGVEQHQNVQSRHENAEQRPPQHVVQQQQYEEYRMQQLLIQQQQQQQQSGGISGAYNGNANAALTSPMRGMQGRLPPPSSDSYTLAPHGVKPQQLDAGGAVPGGYADVYDGAGRGAGTTMAMGRAADAGWMGGTMQSWTGGDMMEGEVEEGEGMEGGAMMVKNGTVGGGAQVSVQYAGGQHYQQQAQQRQQQQTQQLWQQQSLQYEQYQQQLQAQLKQQQAVQQGMGHHRPKSPLESDGTYRPPSRPRSPVSVTGVLGAAASAGAAEFGAGDGHMRGASEGGGAQVGAGMGMMAGIGGPLGMPAVEAVGGMTEVQLGWQQQQHEHQSSDAWYPPPSSGVDETAPGSSSHPKSPRGPKLPRPSAQAQTQVRRPMSPALSQKSGSMAGSQGSTSPLPRQRAAEVADTGVSGSQEWTGPGMSAGGSSGGGSPFQGVVRVAGQDGEQSSGATPSHVVQHMVIGRVAAPAPASSGLQTAAEGSQKKKLSKSASTSAASHGHGHGSKAHGHARPDKKKDKAEESQKKPARKSHRDPQQLHEQEQPPGAPSLDPPPLSSEETAEAQAVHARHSPPSLLEPTGSASEPLLPSLLPLIGQAHASNRGSGLQLQAGPAGSGSLSHALLAGTLPSSASMKRGSTSAALAAAAATTVSGKNGTQQQGGPPGQRQSAVHLVNPGSLLPSMPLPNLVMAGRSHSLNPGIDCQPPVGPLRSNSIGHTVPPCAPGLLHSASMTHLPSSESHLPTGPPPMPVPRNHSTGASSHSSGGSSNDETTGSSRRKSKDDSDKAASRASKPKRPPPTMLPPPHAPQVVKCEWCAQTLAVPGNLPPPSKGVQKLRCGKCLKVCRYAPYDPAHPPRPPHSTSSSRSPPAVKHSPNQVGEEGGGEGDGDALFPPGTEDMLASSLHKKKYGSLRTQTLQRQAGKHIPPPWEGGTGPRLAPAQVRVVRVARSNSSSGLFPPKAMPRSLSQPDHYHSAAISAATAAAAAAICEIQDVPSPSSGGGSESLGDESVSDQGSIRAVSATGSMGVSRRTDATAAVAAAAAAVHRESVTQRSIKGRRYDADSLSAEGNKGRDRESWTSYSSSGGAGSDSGSDDSGELVRATGSMIVDQHVGSDRECSSGASPTNMKQQGKHSGSDKSPNSVGNGRRVKSGKYTGKKLDGALSEESSEAVTRMTVAKGK